MNKFYVNLNLREFYVLREIKQTRKKVTINKFQKNEENKVLYK